MIDGLIKLVIYNVKSHKKTIIEFDKGLNIIVGESDAGKSAIMQALGWLIFNRPVGDKIRSKWGGDTVVTAYFKDGRVRRKKTNSSNEYYLNKTKFQAVRSAIPEEVSNFVNINSINYQAQIDPHFLLSSSAGEVSKFFNKIVDLDNINVSLANLSKQVKDTNNQIKYLGEELTGLRYQIKNFADIDLIERDLALLQDKEKSLDRSVNAYRIVWKLITELEEVEEELVPIQQTLELEAKTNHLLEGCRAISHKKGKIQELWQYIDMYEEAESDEKKYKGILKDEKKVLECLDSQERLNMLLIKERDIKGIIEELIITEFKRKSTKKKIKKMWDYFEDSMGDYCRLCGSSHDHWAL